MNPPGPVHLGSIHTSCVSLATPLNRSSTLMRTSPSRLSTAITLPLNMAFAFKKTAHVRGVGPQTNSPNAPLGYSTVTIAISATHMSDLAITRL